MTTRYVHVVRCKQVNPDGSLNDQIYGDMQITDRICLTDQNGGQSIYDFTALNAVPTIIDVAGDGGGIDNGSDATRQSRLIRITNPDDDSRFFNEEVLDRVTVTVNGAQQIWDFTGENCAAFIIATTGDDIDQDSLVPSDGDLVTNQPSATRLIEVDEVVPANTTTGSGNTEFCAVADMQAICISNDNGAQAIYDLRDDIRDILDTTQYITDDQGNQIPPDNTDPNPYLVFPPGVTDPTTGNAIVQQGPLWKLINISAGGDLFIVTGRALPISGSWTNTPAPNAPAGSAATAVRSGKIVWQDKLGSATDPNNGVIVGDGDSTASCTLFGKISAATFTGIGSSTPPFPVGNFVNDYDPKGNLNYTVPVLGPTANTFTANDFDGAGNLATVATSNGTTGTLTYRAPDGTLLMTNSDDIGEPAYGCVFDQNNDLIVADLFNLYKFAGVNADIPGKLLWQISPGEGPGAFNNLESAIVDIDSDNNVWIIYFDSGGNTGAGKFSDLDGTLLFSSTDANKNYLAIGCDGHGNAFAYFLDDNVGDGHIDCFSQNSTNSSPDSTIDLPPSIAGNNPPSRGQGSGYLHVWPFAVSEDTICVGGEWVVSNFFEEGVSNLYLGKYYGEQVGPDTGPEPSIDGWSTDGNPGGEPATFEETVQLAYPTDPIQSDYEPGTHGFPLHVPLNNQLYYCDVYITVPDASETTITNTHFFLMGIDSTSHATKWTMVVDFLQNDFSTGAPPDNVDITTRSVSAPYGFSNAGA